MAFQLVHNNETPAPLSGEILEKVILGNDLSGLSPLEKVQYVKNICQTIGLNPVTKPIQLMKFQNKEVPYFTKDATEQLRKINRVSIIKIDTHMYEGVYVVTAYASTPDGRQDSSTGAIVTSNLKGDALANAMMKAETKAKRRVTLSICGLGFIDECEVESIPNAQKVDITGHIPPVAFSDDDILDISMVASLDELKAVFTEKTTKFKGHPEILKKIIEIKDKRKNELMSADIRDFIEDMEGK
jgi:hypothetical protein